MCLRDADKLHRHPHRKQKSGSAHWLAQAKLSTPLIGSKLSNQSHRIAEDNTFHTTRLCSKYQPRESSLPPPRGQQRSKRWSCYFGGQLFMTFLPWCFDWFCTLRGCQADLKCCKRRSEQQDIQYGRPKLKANHSHLHSVPLNQVSTDLLGRKVISKAIFLGIARVRLFFVLFLHKSPPRRLRDWSAGGHSLLVDV